jgi:excisionase family DNA binding protein
VNADADYLTTDEAARELGLQTSQTILRRIRAGALEAELVGRSYRVPRSEIERLKRRLQHKRSSPTYRETTAERRAAIRERFVVAGVSGGSSS